jgi:carboxypeptidase family protein/PDZ domain-containing protein
MKRMPLGRSWRRWLAVLAAVSCALLALRAALVRPPAERGPEAPAAAPPPPARIELHVSARADECEARDAGACSPAPAVDSARATAGAEVAGARVRLFRTDAGRVSLEAEVVSDGRGRAQLAVASGQYWVLVDAPARARRSERISIDAGSRTIELALPSARPLSVAVRDAAGQPIAGATVLVRDGDLLPHGASSSALGIASLEHVGGRLDSIQVSAPGHDSALVNPSSRQVEVTLSAPAALEILVQDATGQPAPLAEVSVSGIDFWPPRQLRAGADGVALLEGLSRGTYDLRARLGTRVSGAVPSVTLERGQHQRVALSLGEGRFIGVRVQTGDAEHAEPVAGADVTLVEDGLSPFPLAARTGADGSAELGPLPVGSAAVISVRAQGFMPESVQVQGRSDAPVLVALLRGGHLSGRVVDPEGRAIEGARLEVVGNDAHERPISRQSGNLEAASGMFERSLDGARPVVPMGELGVLSGPLPLPGMPPVGPAPTSAWVSDLDGNYRLDDVPPGRVRLLAHHPDFVEATSETVVLDPGATVVVPIVLERGATLSGRVLDGLGRPVPRARVDALSHQATQVSALTDYDGAFTFRALPARVDILVARPEARQRFVVRKSFSLSPGESRAIELTLPAERAGLGVVVLDGDGRPLPGASVSLLSLDARVPLRASAESDAHGEVSVLEAVGIFASLRVQAPGYRSFEAELDPVPPRLTVRLERGVSVRGRITQVRGRSGVRGATVVLLQAGERRSALSDDAGEYQLDGVALGPATLTVTHPEFSSETWEVTVEPSAREGEAVDLEPIDLVESGAASGVVVDARGEPVRGARVGVGLVPAFVPSGSKPIGFVETDASGHFELRGLTPGRVTLSAYASGAGRGQLADVVVTANEPTTGLRIRLSAHAESARSGPANVAVTLGERHSGADLEVVIVNVAAQSEAERAGVRQGDVLWSVDDEVVLDMADARRALGGAVGSDVVLELDREGETSFARVRRELVR